MGTFCIYIHTNKITGKKYVGYTSDKTPERRWGKNGNGYIKCPYIYYAIQKYGWDNFEHEIRLTGLTHEEACEAERRYIAILRTNDSRFGYNLTKGGDGYDLGRNSSDPEVSKARARKYLEDHREAVREQHRQYYLTHKEHVKEKAAKWFENNPERAAKIGKEYREANREKKRLYDIKYNQEHKEHRREIDKAYREKRKAANPKVYRKPVECIDTGEVFESIRAASDHFGFSFASVSMNVRGKTQICHGLRFRFVNSN